jgi:hypothetical protein
MKSSAYSYLMTSDAKEINKDLQSLRSFYLYILEAGTQILFLWLS